MKTVCSECNGSKWVNTVGAKTIATVEADPFGDPCPKCVPRVGGVVTVPMTAAKDALDRETPAPPPVAYQPEALALLGRTVAAVEQAAAEAKPTPEEVATWEAEKAAQTARAEAHKAHMDRAEERALKTLAIEERKAKALEQIAQLLECIADRMPR